MYLDWGGSWIEVAARLSFNWDFKYNKFTTLEAIFQEVVSPKAVALKPSIIENVKWG